MSMEFDESAEEGHHQPLVSLNNIKQWPILDFIKGTKFSLVTIVLTQRGQTMFFYFFLEPSLFFAEGTQCPSLNTYAIEQRHNNGRYSGDCRPVSIRGFDIFSISLLVSLYFSVVVYARSYDFSEKLKLSHVESGWVTATEDYRTLRVQ